MKTVLFYLAVIFLLSAGNANAQLRAKDPIHVNNAEEAKWVIKVLKVELGLDETQQVRVQKIFDNYIRRIEKAREEYAADTAQLNQRLKLLVNNRDFTLYRTVGEENAEALNALIPQMRQKIAEMKKAAGVK